ncbi:hypothetical protein D3C84_731230 [compost metagenome]
MPLAGAELVPIGVGRGDHRADAQLHAFGLEQEDIKQVQIAFAGAVATVRIGTGADRCGGAQQLRDADEVVGRNRQRPAHQQIVGVDIRVVVLRGVVVLQVHPRCEVQRVVTFVGRVSVVRLGTHGGRY